MAKKGTAGVISAQKGQKGQQDITGFEPEKIEPIEEAAEPYVHVLEQIEKLKELLETAEENMAKVMKANLKAVDMDDGISRRAYVFIDGKGRSWNLIHDEQVKEKMKAKPTAQPK